MEIGTKVVVIIGVFQTHINFPSVAKQQGVSISTGRFQKATLTVTNEVEVEKYRIRAF